MSFVRRFARNRGAVVGCLVLLAVIAVAALAPILYPTSPWRLVGRPFLAPYALERFPLGTDARGRDVMAGLMHGARVSLLLGVVCPSVMAAWTYSRLLSDRTSPRTSRAIGGHDTIAIASTMEAIVGCRMATMTIASAKLGMVWKNSVKRMRASSTSPPA